MRISKQEKETLKIEEKARELHHKEVLRLEKESHHENKIAPSDDIIILKNINKIYPNHVQAVYDFNLSIKENEFIVLVGPSGCGKSTTLKMIAGLEDITSGDLYINQKYSNFALSKDRNLAMVFQSYALYPTMSVYKNIAFPLMIRGEKKDVIDEKVRNIAQILELDDDLLNRRPAALSGGQRQRVALARAMVKGTKILLMDEPLSNLDAKLRASVRGEIVDLHKRINATTIYVTHDQVEAMTMSDRLVVMNNGFVEQIGTPQEIYDHPKTLFVATFIGSPAMNILKSDLKKDVLKLENGFEIKLTKEQKVTLDKYYVDVINEINEDIKVTSAKREKRIDDLRKVGYLKDLEKLDALSNKQANKLAVKKQKLSKAKPEHEKALSEEVEQLTKQYQQEYDSLKAQIESKEYPLLPDDKLQQIVMDDIHIKAFDHELNKQREMLKQYEKISAEEEKELLLGVRPEDILLEADKNDHDNLSSKMVVHIDLCELLGHEYFLSFNISETLCNLKASAYQEILPDQDMDCYLDLDKVHLFDPVAKRNIF